MVESCRDVIAKSENNIKDLMLVNNYNSESEGYPLISNSMGNHIETNLGRPRKTRCDAVNPKFPTIINFHTTWCKYSVQFMSLWKELQKEFCSDPVNFIDIPCDSRKDLCKKFNISSFPTIKMLSDGEVYDFEKRRNKEYKPINIKHKFHPLNSTANISQFMKIFRSQFMNISNNNNIASSVFLPRYGKELLF